MYWKLWKIFSVLAIYRETKGHLPWNAEEQSYREAGVGKKCTGSLDLDQKDQLRKIDLIRYFCSGFESSHVDPILFIWILIKSSWSNIFWTGFRFWKKLIFLIKIQLFWAFYAFGEIEWVLAVSRGGARESTPQMPTLAPELSFFLQYSQKYFPTLQFSYEKLNHVTKIWFWRWDQSADGS